MCLARSLASSRCSQVPHTLLFSTSVDDASVALSTPSPLPPLRSFCSGFLTPHREILTGATTCFEGLLLARLAFPEKSLDSIDVVIRMGVDLREIFQQKMQWLLSAGVSFSVLPFFFFFFLLSLETVTLLFDLG